MPGDLLADALADLIDRPRAVVLVTGAVGAGKSTACREAASRLRARGIPAGGIVAERVLAGGETAGYDALDLRTGARRTLARTRPPGIPVGRFFMDPQALKFARAALREAAETARVVFVDEVGLWELEGGGLAGSLRMLLAADLILVIAAREGLAGAIESVFGIRGALAWPMKAAN